MLPCTLTQYRTLLRIWMTAAIYKTKLFARNEMIWPSSFFDWLRKHNPQNLSKTYNILNFVSILTFIFSPILWSNLTFQIFFKLATLLFLQISATWSINQKYCFDVRANPWSFECFEKFKRLKDYVMMHLFYKLTFSGQEAIL